MKNPLLNQDFLKQLSLQTEREVFAKIIALDFDENPMEEISGRITSGTITIDGNSSSRRTCSLSIVANELNIHEYYWGLKTKFKLYVGLRNYIDNENYEDIIWFPYGFFLITSFNTSQTVNSFTISIQGKDKMSLLNGEMGGVVTALTHNFGEWDEEVAPGYIQTKQLPIEDIIREAVHEFAGEPYQNIIINDLDIPAVELLEYRGQETLYMLKDVLKNEISNITMDGKQVWKDSKGNLKEIGSLADEEYDKMLDLGDNIVNNPEYFYSSSDEDCKIPYTIVRCEYGSLVGYRPTDLVFAGDLISNVGDSITSSVLDKIVNMLGEYEYFYNIDGQFVFQKKRTFLNISWNNLKQDDEEIYAESMAYTSGYCYSFVNSQLITSFQNTPNYAEVKNDYSVWGSRPSTTGRTDGLAIHMRYAIDKKPEEYVSYEGNKIIAGESLDWREIIYQMARDYYRFGQNDDFTSKIATNNPDLYPTGYTGYEQYYTDLYSFWRDLYMPDYTQSYVVAFCTKKKFDANKKDYFLLRQSNEFDSNIAYYSRSKNNISFKFEKIGQDDFVKNPNKYVYFENCYEKEKDYDANETYYTLEEVKYKDNGWNVDIDKNPEYLNFWFDFLDTEGEISKYSVKNIGSRPKAENDTKVTAIYYREIPTVLFVDKINDNIKSQYSGYTLLQLSEGLEGLFTVSGQGISAHDKINDLLYKNTYCAESISVSSIPVYHLEPNTRILVRDDESGINGEYIVNRISFSMGHSGTMSISATKAVKNIF